MQMRRIMAEQTRQGFHLAPNQRIFQLYFARHDSHHIGDYSRLELARALDYGHEFALDEVGGRFEQFNGGRPVLHIDYSHCDSTLACCYSRRFSSSSSFSAVRRPILASSTLFTNPSI